MQKILAGCREEASILGSEHPNCPWEVENSKWFCCSVKCPWDMLLWGTLSHITVKKYPVSYISSTNTALQTKMLICFCILQVAVLRLGVLCAWKDYNPWDKIRLFPVKERWWKNLLLHNTKICETVLSVFYLGHWGERSSLLPILYYSKHFNSLNCCHLF